ncbi:MAG: tyrosine-type recombinase/integrase [Solirubrobacterales bacterium]|nr:tyrosine-type recombinase/integrase [Solirubrobacterales bacterium]
MKDPSRVRLSGPLREFGKGFVVELARQGYSPLGATLQLRLMARTSRWLQAEGLRVGQLTDDVVERCLAAQRAAGRRDYVTARAMAPLLAYLRGLGLVAPASPSRPSSRAEELGERFRRYLTVERSLASGTVTGYVDAVEPFLAGLDEEQLELRELSAGRVTAFVVARCPGQSRGAAKMTVTALRSLLGFLHVEGLIGGSLVGAVPSVASWRLSGLPRFLEPDQARALLDSCDQQTVVGRRDLAILTLLLRLGLRAGEVADLCLEDVDWCAGELVVTGKGRRSERLPLPVDVGEAITGYLRDSRPHSALDRTVFIRVKAPHRRLSTGGITQVVAAAGRRAGLGQIHAHRLRHTAATSMLRAGAPLHEIGQVLRHREQLSTAIYAKVDRAALSSLARPWPGAGS